MKHLADQNTYKKLQENITYKLKEVIYTKLEIPYKNGFLLINWYQFCKPPQNHRTSKLYFLKKIRINPMGIHPIVSSCDSITEKNIPICRQMATTICNKFALICKRHNQIHKPN